jgi:CBS domain-containing protein
MTVAAVLRFKGLDVAAAAPDATVAEVATQLSRLKIGAVVVKDAGGKLLGIISERDIVHALAAHGAAALDLLAEELMTRAVRTVTPQTTVAEAMTMMTTGRFRHLPVVDQGAMVGIISIGDVVKAKIMQQEAEVDSLKAYVSGTA